MRCATRRWGALVAVALAVAGCGEPKRTDLFQPGPTVDVPAGVDTAPAPDMGVAGECSASAQCDDRLACTLDECVFGGRCEHTAMPSMCPAGQRCIVGVGCASGTTCTTSAQCDDGVACTRDLCAVGGRCQNINDDAQCTGGQVCTSAGCAAQGTCRTDADCQDGTHCNGAETCSMGMCRAGAAVRCDDGDPCTGDVCNERMRACDHPAVDPCGGSLMPGTYVLSPPVQYTCPLYSLGPISMITLSASAGGIQVTGFPVPLSGATPASGMFSTLGTDVRARTFRLTLQGNFTGATVFTGAFSVACPDCGGGDGCATGSGFFTATRR
jgi:hypothetical protein